MHELVLMYQRMAWINRESAANWRKLAQDSPDGLALLMLTNAEINEQQARDDEARANQILSRLN